MKINLYLDILEILPALSLEGSHETRVSNDSLRKLGQRDRKSRLRDCLVSLIIGTYSTDRALKVSSRS